MAAIGFAGGILGGLGGLSGPAADPVGQRARLAQGRAPRHFPDLQLDRAAAAALCIQIATGLVKPDVIWLALIAFPGTIIGAWLGARDLSRAERQEFPRRRAWPVVSVRDRSGVEQHCSELSARMAAICTDVDCCTPPREPANGRASMSSTSFSREHFGLLLGFIGMAIFGGTLPATRLAVSAIDPIALTAMRTAIAGLCSLAAAGRAAPAAAAAPAVAAARDRHALRQHPVSVADGAAACRRVDASHGGVVLGVLPIATALVAVAITHERPRPLFWIASVAGAALVIAFALRQGGGTLSAGDLLSVRGGRGLSDRLRLLRTAHRARCRAGK